MAIDMLFFLVTAAAHWHAKREHAQQAAAARDAAEHLRTAYQAAASVPMGLLYQRGRRLSQPLRHKQVAHLRAAVPELAEQILAEPGWHALAATLADTESAGHDPAALLTEAAGQRELGIADSLSDVLVWRLRRLADLPADAATMPDHTPSAAKGSGRAVSPAPNRDDRPRKTR
jgi:hypothetical protein